jgi:hypothetical protein
VNPVWYGIAVLIAATACQSSDSDSISLHVDERIQTVVDRGVGVFHLHLLGIHLPKRQRSVTRFALRGFAQRAAWPLHTCGNPRGTTHRPLREPFAS